MAWWSLSRWMRHPKRQTADVRPGSLHTCCAWCAGNVHVELRFLDKRFTRKEQFFQTFQALASQWGEELLDAREAPEADLRAMIAYRQTHNVPIQYADGHEEDGDTGTQAPWHWGKPWLITFRVPTEG